MVVFGRWGGGSPGEQLPLSLSHTCTFLYPKNLAVHQTHLMMSSLVWMPYVAGVDRKVRREMEQCGRNQAATVAGKT